MTRPKPIAEAHQACDADRISPIELRWVEFYGEMLDHYNRIDSKVAVPQMAVRMLAKRGGLQQLLHLLMHEGVPRMAALCRHEMTLRHEFLLHMLAKFPPDTAEDAESAAEEMASDLATIDSPEGALRMLKLLERLQRREIYLISKKPEGKQVH